MKYRGNVSIFFFCTSFSSAWLNYNDFFFRRAELKEHNVNRVCLPTPWGTSLKRFNVVQLKCTSILQTANLHQDLSSEARY